MTRADSYIELGEIERHHAFLASASDHDIITKPRW
jgi:hypothetical protein